MFTCSEIGKSPAPIIVQPGDAVPTNDEFRTCINDLTDEARAAMFSNIVDNLQHYQPALGPNYAARCLSMPKLPDRIGGYLGKRWSPSCGPYTRISHKWMDFVYWDIHHPIQNYNIYNFQVCVKGGSPTDPFNYLQEGVTVKMLDITKNPVRCLADDNPETFVGGSGETLVITYPTQRGCLNGQFATVLVQMPPEQLPPGVELIVLQRQ